MNTNEKVQLLNRCSKNCVVKPHKNQQTPTSERERNLSLVNYSVFVFQIQPAPVPKFSSYPHHKHESSYKLDKAEVPYHYHTFYPKRKLPSKFDTHDNIDISEYAEEEYDGHYYADNKLPVAPADAVSLSLAYEFAKRAGTATKEDGLNFGPRTIPKDGTVIKARKNTHEDRLHGFDRQVVQPRYPSSKSGLSRHEAVEEEEYEQESNYGGSANYLSYADLGYVPETQKEQGHFFGGPINSYNDHIIPYEHKEEHLRPLPKPCHRRGHMRVRNHEAEDYSEEDGSQYHWEDREEGHHFHVKPEKVSKGHSPTNKLRPSKGYPKYT